MTAQQLLDAGLHCYNKKKLMDALFYFEHLLKLDSENLDLIYTVVTVLQEMGDYKKSIFYSESLVTLSPNNAEFLLVHAENNYFLQAYVKAMPIYLKLHNLYPLNTHILQRLLDIYTRQNNRCEVSRIKSLLLQVEGKISIAKVEIEETVNLALSLVEQNRTSEAKYLINGVLLLDNDNINANGIYGVMLKDEAEFEKALNYLEKIKFEPSGLYVAPYSECLVKVRGMLSSISFLEQRTKKYPKEHNSIKLLGFNYYSNEEYNKAYATCRSIKTHFQDDCYFKKIMAMSRFMAINEDNRWVNEDKLIAAARQLHAIYELLPDDEDILIQLVKYYLNIGEIKKAYEMTCNGFFASNNVKEWNKHPYYLAVRDKESFFNSYIAGRCVRTSFYSNESVRNKIWNGESIENNKIVILKEQGIGDEILFASNYGWVIEKALQVDIFCSSRLEASFTRLFPEANFHSMIEVNGSSYVPTNLDKLIFSADKIILAGDLPCFNYGSTKLSLYNECFYFIDDFKKQYWKEKLEAIIGVNKPKVGIIWRSGNIDSSRSVHYLNETEVAYIIAAIPEVEFVNCMYVKCDKEVGKINKLAKVKLHQIDGLDQKNDFENTAAMLSNLDLLVGAYTATLSLSAAVGTPAVAYSADYLKEDGKLKKDAFYYSNVSHISLPVNDSIKRKEAIGLIIDEIRSKLFI
ncbi:tetratricopeptide repeat protein [Zobellella sp. An-6]|uniref:tetratricopeptide repeat protein n=1 Tax=Zobellella sp. An-6 TaxID=3400218 RepID=UPI00404243B0